jgi:ABC-type uncharacterized transport system ATPase subunit
VLPNLNIGRSRVNRTTSSHPRQRLEIGNLVTENPIVLLQESLTELAGSDTVVTA